MKPLNVYRTLAYIKIVGALTVIGASYQNCSRPHFEVDQLAKADKVGSESVFGRDPGEDPIKLDDPDDHNPGADPTACKDSSSLKIKFEFECSNVRSEKFGGNLILTSAVKIVIVNKATRTKVCEMKGDYRSEILNTKTLSFAPCGQLPEGIYSAHIMDSDSTSTNFAGSSLNKDITFRVNNSGGLCLTRTHNVKLLYDFNAKDNRYSEYVKLFGSGSNSESQTKCDSNKSPLIISMNSQSRGVRLSAPLEGIQFDILGLRSLPFPHAKKQISWFVQGSDEYFFITLPNANGEVNGINEMFGDSTRGPDGKFAKNGYLALAKYDNDGDNFITNQDPVFEKLRLWRDVNRDGLSEPSELFTLQDKSIVLIDLNYDARYVEVDSYGNKTMMKSVVKTEDGQLHLLFDLWFRYINITK